MPPRKQNPQPGTAGFVLRFSGFLACLCPCLAVFLSGGEAAALDSYPVGDMWGRRVELLHSPDGGTIYLAVESPSMEAQIKAFDTSAMAWSGETLTAPGTGSTCRRWGEQGYAVDREGNIHVAWSERDFVDRSLECGDLAEDAAGVRIKHVMFDAASGSWTAERIIAERFFGDANCFFHKLDMAADSSGRLLVVFLTGVPDGSPGQAAFLLFDGEAWLERADLADWKIDPHAGGSATHPSLWAGHTDRLDGFGAISAHIEVFGAGASSPTESRAFPLADAPAGGRVATSPMVIAGAGDDVHLVWSDSCESTVTPGAWYTCAVNTAARTGEEWQPMAELAGPELLTDTGSAAGAFPAVAVSRTGVRAVVIATRGRLYAAVSEGTGGWSRPELLELDKPVVEVNEAVLQPVAILPADDHVFLVAWTTEDTQDPVRPGRA
ncbi:MAG: hypothetical protein ABIJ56_01905 [Pseudomonadota bacterium]